MENTVLLAGLLIIVFKIAVHLDSIAHTLKEDLKRKHGKDW